MPLGAITVPPSAVLKSKGASGAGPGPGDAPKQSREEYRAMKELEEARKAGTAPAVQDEEGRDINPHIPQFITDSPWYLGTTHSTLKHQRPHPERIKSQTLSTIADWYNRGTTSKVATKFRKGSCENCGSMTHQKRDCFERPRKMGAKFTGEDIAPDEHIQPDLKLDWEGKRDRWNGYDPTDHAVIYKEYEKLEEARKMVKAERIAEGLEEDAEKAKEAAAEEAAAALKDIHDEDKYADEADMPGVRIDDDSRTKITVRNLRIREDTAKYLYNLDPNSAYYDPKSRSMRENPFEQHGKKADEVKFGGENFIRYTGEVMDVNKAQLFAWDAKKRGVDVHALAEPTKLEVLKKEIEGKKLGFKDAQKMAILEKYGGEEHFDSVPKELLLAQTETYREYSRKGNVLKGEERAVVKSRFEEDVHPNNHTAAWGSWWSEGKWGYSCCHSLVHNSYCTGEAGKAATAVSQTAKPTTAALKDLPEADPTPWRFVRAIEGQLLNAKIDYTQFMADAALRTQRLKYKLLNDQLIYHANIYDERRDRPPIVPKRSHLLHDDVILLDLALPMILLLFNDLVAPR